MNHATGNCDCAHEYPPRKEAPSSLSKDKNLVFVPFWNEFLGPDGKPNDSLYVEDKLHNNAEGYKIRVRIVKQYLDGK